MNRPSPSELDTERPRWLPMTCLRLRGREALVVVTLVGLFWILAPGIARRLFPIDFPPDYRTPYEASEDYWRYRDFVRQAVEDEQTLIVGDSVIWGEYVSADQTLSAVLNKRLGETRFANGGINGLHPLAIHGLLRHYGQPVRGRPVMIHCNLLWMSSAERDLTGDSESSFNHPRLIPQFNRSLTSYRADATDRMSVFVEQHVAFRQWVRHLWLTYLDGQDLSRWTLEHPYELPQNKLLGIVARDSRQTDANWLQRSIPRQAYDWRTIESSEQWAALQRTIAYLESQDCDVFVLVGPFNPHLLTDANRAQWQMLRTSIVEALAASNVKHAAPDPLPSENYADASHPLAVGYERLAEQLLHDSQFRTWLGRE